MSECPHCNSTFEEGETFCPECDEPVRSSQIPPRTVNLGSIFGGVSKGRSPDSFTKEDMLGGLRTSAQGTPMDDFLPSTKWEDYTASLLEVLFKKHLVFPSEIDQELKPDKKDD